MTTWRIVRRCSGAAFILLAGLSGVPVFTAEIPPAEEQLKNFHLPPGFEVQLVASDPAIGQPMNLNFDARGRLWVTSSVEYPYPVAGEGVQDRPERFGKPSDHAPRDRITVLADIGADGKAASITHFAEGLNIPIGITPIGNGDQAIGYSIPAIYRFADENKDGKSDEKKELYGRFGNVDTHGMSNAYTRWLDGWIYGCHGFSNQSAITDAGGRVTSLRSGNTYRFKEDGSHFQQFTWGQVNPFGLTFDPLGNLYSADCHSKPLYLLLRGAKYPHFGDQADGLRIGPEMMRHNHGSTGICGPAYYAAEHFPPEFRDNLFVCNPVTGRINRDKLAAHGSTYECVEQPDFVTYDGDLFRPVDLQVGPDGALYIADFCNPVIGHYEAPLDHPERDRNHGRIWRIIYRGEDGEGSAPKMMPDLTKLSAVELFGLLDDPNLQVRTLATNYIVDAHADAAPALTEKSLAEGETPNARACYLWILERLSALDDETLDKYADDDDRLVRVHAMRILAERPKWSGLNRHSARLNLFDGDGFVRRAAADALGQHPHADQVPELLAKWEQTPAEDTHLIHTIRLALRSHVRDEAVVAALSQREFGEDAAKKLVEIAAAADSEVAAPLFLAFAEPGTVSAEVIQQAATGIARQGTRQQLQQLLKQSPQWFADDRERQFAILAAVVEGLEQKGVDVREQDGVKEAVERLAPQQVETLSAARQNWTNRKVPELPDSNSPWGVRQRGSADGVADGLFWDSIAGGEQLTGILRSQKFAMPERLTFWMCGHNGQPNTADARLNHIRLVDAETGEELAKEFPPRNDTAQKFEWTLKEHTGKHVAVEIIDAHQGKAYAWIGVGRFAPAVARVPSPDAGQQDLALVKMIGQFQLRQFAGDMRNVSQSDEHPLALRRAALESHVALIDASDRLSTLAIALDAAQQPNEFRAHAAQLLAGIDADEARAALAQALARAPAELQRQIAVALGQSDKGRGTLLETIAAGKASPRLLQEARIAESFEANAGEADRRRVAEMLKSLPPANEQIATRIQKQHERFAAAETSAERGLALYEKHFAACHRVGDEGGLIGPQLDGIGNRGLARVLEDVLDPNRNVDVAFRTVNLELQNGKILSGIERRREGAVLVIADAEGKELRVRLADIAGQRRTNLSLMPSNFAEALREEEINDLMAWLLEQASTEETTSRAP